MVQGGNHLLSLQVKNTFIDINSCEEDGAEADGREFLLSCLRKRQVSEPVQRMQRQSSCQSGTDTRALPGGSFRKDGLLEEEEFKADELDEPEGEESETERDPSWLFGQATPACRQETDPNWPTFAMGRQETEQYWPSWGYPEEAGTCPSSDQVTGPATGTVWSFGTVLGGPGDLGNTGGVLPTPSPAEAPGAAWGTWATRPYAPYPDANNADLMSTVVSGHGMRDSMVQPPEWDGVSTVMMRNLPNKYTQQMLLEELHQSGFAGTYDFMYLPIDTETSANRGYAFINFTDPSLAWMLRTTYEGQKMSRFNSDKVVSVSPAALQGFEANYAHYSTARVNRGDPAARPLFLRESSMRQLAPKNDGSRRRGGRRTTCSLIDMAARQQQQQVTMANPGMARDNLQVHAGLAAVKAAAAMNRRDNPPSYGSPGGAAVQIIKAAGVSKQQQAVARFCPYCGAKCKPVFKFCQFCGGSLKLMV